MQDKIITKFTQIIPFRRTHAQLSQKLQSLMLELGTHNIKNHMYVNFWARKLLFLNVLYLWMGLSQILCSLSTGWFCLVRENGVKGLLSPQVMYNLYCSSMKCDLLWDHIQGEDVFHPSFELFSISYVFLSVK